MLRSYYLGWLLDAAQLEVGLFDEACESQDLDCGWLARHGASFVSRQCF
jgi:hypothetical protein